MNVKMNKMKIIDNKFFYNLLINLEMNSIKFLKAQFFIFSKNIMNIKIARYLIIMLRNNKNKILCYYLN